jgi:hypothetical protein
MGAWRDATNQAADDAEGEGIEKAASLIAAALAYPDLPKARCVVQAGAILRRHYQADGMDDPGRQEPLAGVDGDERLWRALRIVASYGSQSRIYAWRADQKGLALRDAEAELRDWWKAQQP